MKALHEYYDRVSLELTRLSNDFIVKLGFFCEAQTDSADARFYVEILPNLLQLLDRDDKEVCIDGETKTLREHRKNIIWRILNKPLKEEKLSNIVSMFK